MSTTLSTPNLSTLASTSQLAAIATRAYSPVAWADAVVRCDVSAGAKAFAFLMLSNFGHTTGRCKRRVDTLADQLGKSIRTVRRYATELVERGLLLRWQNSRHKCNRYQAVTPAEVNRPKDPSVGVKQMPLELEPGPPARVEAPSKPLAEAVPVEPQKKVSPVGGHPSCPPRTGNPNSKGKVRWLEAPSGFAQRPRATFQPSPKGEAARSTLRKSGVAGVAVTYLVFVCSPHELDWLASELVMAGDRVRNPTRYIAKLFNDLAAGNANDKRRKPDPRRVGLYEHRDLEAEAAEVEQKRKVSPVPAPTPPPLSEWADGWRQAWSELGTGVRWRGDRAYEAAARSGTETDRRQWLTRWLLDVHGLDLGHAPIAEVDDPRRRRLLLGIVEHRSQHVGEHPELYPGDPNAWLRVGYVIPPELALDEDVAALERQEVAAKVEAEAEADAQRRTRLSAVRAFLGKL